MWPERPVRPGCRLLEGLMETGQASPRKKGEKKGRAGPARGGTELAFIYVGRHASAARGGLDPGKGLLVHESLGKPGGVWVAARYWIHDWFARLIIRC